MPLPCGFVFIDFNQYSQYCGDHISCPCSGGPSHTAAVIAAAVLLLLLAAAALVYTRCHLNIKLWYHNSYGDYELNGKTSAPVITGLVSSP